MSEEEEGGGGGGGEFNTGANCSWGGSLNMCWLPHTMSCACLTFEQAGIIISP